MEWIVLWIGVNFLIGYAIGKPKGQAVSSAFICVLLGPIGWIVAAVSKGNVKKCPFCSEDIKPDAKVCRYCGRELPLPDPTTVAAAGEKIQVDWSATTKSCLRLALIIGALVVFVIVVVSITKSH
jgi:hypothetical protein